LLETTIKNAESGKIQTMETKPTSWSSQTKSFVTLIILVIIGFLLYQFNSAIAPMVLSVILAFVLSPLVGIVERRLRLKRVLAAILVYLVLIALIVVAGILLAPVLVNQFTLFIGRIRELLEEAKVLFSGPIEYAGLKINGPEVLNQIETFFQAWTEPLVGSALDILATLVEGVVWGIFMTFISFYLILDSTKLVRWIDHLVLPAYRAEFVRLREEINIVWSAFFRGQLLLSLVVMSILTTVCLIIGMPYALVLGIMAGLMEFIPSVGHGIWLVTVSLLALLVGSTWIPVPNWTFWLLVLAIQLIFTQFDLNYLIPRIIGRSVHLPPLVVLIGIIVGASLGGVLGVALAAPTIASVRVIMRYISSRLFDESFPDDISTPFLPPPELRWWHRRRIKTNHLD
jgi:predicted PurR-regulated permease PerM